MSPLWVMPLSAPVVSDVVVVMHHNRAVNTAVRTITANDPSVQVVEYGSLEYALTIHRTAGRVVWVSHGSKDGILAGSQVLSWRAFSDMIEMTPGNDIVLACDSNEITQYVVRSSVFSFGMIDAILGGLITSLVLFSSMGTLGNIDSIYFKFTKRLTVLFNDPSAPIFLHYIGGGSPPPSPPTYDFYYKSMYWDAYNINPDDEVFYDHPDYTYYYHTMVGVGPSRDFTIDRTTKDKYGTAIGGMAAQHVSRDKVEFWKAGGMGPIIDAILTVGIALGLISAGTTLAVAAAIASVFAAIGIGVSIIASVFLPDETGSGWIFHEIPERGVERIKIGRSWWIHLVYSGVGSSPIPVLAWPEPCDGHYIQT
ncbi:MAG: hypothetical protein K9W43_13760 [Candidatus Thorarchaeota archaeon]|nr:hypothetical protein [Candidatus Thorarchaeota archaeon]